MVYVTRWARDGAVTVGDVELAAPHKVVLIGDFIDLWVSRDNNTIRPYQETFDIVNSRIALRREL
jgi:hypothetical protein